MEDQVSETLLIAQYVPVSTIYRALDITNFFAFTSSMDPLTIKQTFMIIQTKYNEVYNMLYKYYEGKVYHVISRNHMGKNTSRSNDYAQKGST